MRRPSPSLVVSILALVLATAGTSIAAVNFAKNAGAVDGKSATGAASGTGKAAGKLVATANEGPLRGKVPARFLDLSGVVAGSKQTFAQGIEVVDNASGAAVPLGGAPSLGLFTATCVDQSNVAGKEDPQATITFTNSSGQTVNFSRNIGSADHVVSTVAAAATTSFTINNANTFHAYAQVGATHYVIDGVIRQDGKDTATGVCAVYGYALVL